MAKVKQSTKKNLKMKQSKVGKTDSKSAGSKVGTKAPKLAAPKTPYKKTEFFNALSEQTGVAKKEVVKIFDSLKAIIQIHLGKGGPSQFILPGLVKMTVVNKPATKARKGVNPFTKEEMMFKAKPARKLVKIRALKMLKEMV